MCERVNTGTSKRVTSAHHRDNFYLFHSKGEDSLYNRLTAADRGQKEDKRIKNRIEESEANGSVDSHLLFFCSLCYSSLSALFLSGSLAPALVCDLHLKGFCCCVSTLPSSVPPPLPTPTCPPPHLFFM